MIKEEENSSSESGVQVKEEGCGGAAIKKEGEDDSEQTEDGDKEKAGGSGDSPNVKKEGIKQEKGAIKKEPVVKTEKDHRDAQRAKEAKENEIIRDLKAQLK